MICDVFNNTVSSSDNVTSKAKLINDESERKRKEAAVTLNEALMQHFYGRNEEQI
jgi:hypothetical protein